MRLVSLLVAEAFFCSSILPVWGEPFCHSSHLRPSASDGANRKDLIQDLRETEAVKDGGITVDAGLAPEQRLMLESAIAGTTWFLSWPIQSSDPEIQRLSQKARELFGSSDVKILFTVDDVPKLMGQIMKDPRFQKDLYEQEMSAKGVGRAMVSKIGEKEYVITYDYRMVRHGMAALITGLAHEVVAHMSIEGRVQGLTPFEEEALAYRLEIKYLEALLSDQELLAQFAGPGEVVLRELRELLQSEKRILAWFERDIALAKQEEGLKDWQAIGLFGGVGAAVVGGVGFVIWRRNQQLKGARRVVQSAYEAATGNLFAELSPHLQNRLIQAYWRHGRMPRDFLREALPKEKRSPFLDRLRATDRKERARDGAQRFSLSALPSNFSEWYLAAWEARLQKDLAEIPEERANERILKYDPVAGVRTRRVGRYQARFNPRRASGTIVASATEPRNVKVFRPYDESQDPFSRYTEESKLGFIELPDGSSYFIIPNKSPIFWGHGLLVATEPRVQVITEKDIQAAIQFAQRTGMTVYYNAIGGGASVNRFHMHIVPGAFPIHEAETEPIPTKSIAGIGPLHGVWEGFLPRQYKNNASPHLVFQTDHPLAAARMHEWWRYDFEDGIPQNIIFHRNEAGTFGLSTDPHMKVIDLLGGLDPSSAEYGRSLTFYDGEVFNTITPQRIDAALKRMATPQGEFTQRLKGFLQARAVADGGSRTAKDGADRISEWPALRGHLKLFEITRDPELKIAELGAIQEGLFRHPSVPRDKVIEHLLEDYPNAKGISLQSHILSVLIHLGIQHPKVQELFEKELREKAAHQDYTAHLLLQEALMAFAGTISRGETTAISPQRIGLIKQLLSHPDEEVSYAALYVLVSAFRGAPGKSPILAASDVNQDPAFIKQLQHLITSRNISTAYLSEELMKRVELSSQTQEPVIGSYVEWLEKHALQKTEVNPELNDEELRTFYTLIQEGKGNSPREFLGDLFRGGKKVLFLSDVSHSGRSLPFLAEDILAWQEEVELNRVGLPFPESEEENLQKFVRGEISLEEWEYGKRSFLREKGDLEGLAYAASFRQMMRKLNGKVRFIFYGKGAGEEGEFAVMTQLKPIQDTLRELAQPRILVLGIPLMGAQLARKHLKTHNDWVTLSIAQELAEEIGEEQIASLLQVDEEKWFWDHFGSVHNLVEVVERFPVTESFAVNMQGPHGRLQFSRVYQQPFLGAWDGLLFRKTGSHYTVSGKETVWHKQRLGAGGSGVKSMALVFGGVAWIEAGNYVYRLWADEKSAYLQRHQRPRYTPRGDVHPVAFNRLFTVGRHSPDYALNDSHLAELHFTIMVVRDARGRLGLAIEDKDSPNGTKIAWREIQEARDGGMSRRNFFKVLGGAGAAVVIGAWGIPRAIDYLKTLGLSPTPEQFLMKLDEVERRLSQTSDEPERARLFLTEIFPLFMAGANYTAHRMKFGAPEGEKADFISPELRAKLLELSRAIHPILGEGMEKLFNIRDDLLKVEEWHGEPSTRHEGALGVVQKMNRGYLMKQGFFVDFTLTRFKEVPWGAWMAYPVKITPWGKATLSDQKSAEIYDFVPLDPNTPVLLLAMTDGETILLASRNIRDHVRNRMIPVMEGKTIRRYYGLPERFVSGISKLYSNDFSTLLSKKGGEEIIHTAVREDVILHELIHAILEDFMASSPDLEDHDSPDVEVPVYLTQLAVSAVPHTVFATLADFIAYGDQVDPTALNALEVILSAFVEKGRERGLLEGKTAKKWLRFLEYPDWASSEGHALLHFLAGIEKSALQDIAKDVLNERYGKDLAGRILVEVSKVRISASDGGWREKRAEDVANWYVEPLDAPHWSEPFGGKMWIRRGKFLHRFEVIGELVSYVQIEEVRVGDEIKNIERKTAHFDVGRAASFDLDSGNFKISDDFLPRYPLALIVERDIRGSIRFTVEDKNMKRGTTIAWNRPQAAADGADQTGESLSALLITASGEKMEIPVVSPRDVRPFAEAVRMLRRGIKTPLQTIYYPGIGFDLFGPLSVTFQHGDQTIVGVDPLDPATPDSRVMKTVQEKAKETLEILGGDKQVVIIKSRLDILGQKVTRLEWTMNSEMGRKQVILYRADALDLTADRLPETQNGYDMYFVRSVAFPITMQANLKSLNPDGIVMFQNVVDEAKGEEALLAAGLLERKDLADRIDVVIGEVQRYVFWRKKGTPPEKVGDGGVKSLAAERAERLRTALLEAIQKTLLEKSPGMPAETIRVEAEKVYETGLDLVEWDEVIRQLEQEFINSPEILLRAKFILREWVKMENRNRITNRNQPILSPEKDILLKDTLPGHLRTGSVMVLSKSLLNQVPVIEADLLNFFQTHPALQSVLFLPTSDPHLRGIFKDRTIHPRDFAVKMRRDFGVAQPKIVFFMDEKDYALWSDHASGSIYGPERQYYADVVYIKVEQLDVIAMLKLGQALLADDVALQPQNLKDTEKILLQILTGLSPSLLSLTDMNSEFDYIHKILVDILLPQL